MYTITCRTLTGREVECIMPTGKTIADLIESVRIKMDDVIGERQEVFLCYPAVKNLPKHEGHQPLTVNLAELLGKPGAYTMTVTYKTRASSMTFGSAVDPTQTDALLPKPPETHSRCCAML